MNFEAMAHDVFISHAAKDKAVADTACAALEAAGIRCWIAPRDVQPGRSFAGEITRAIQSSRVMVLIFSAQTNNSEQVLREVELAAKAQLHIVQFRIEEAALNDDLEYYLSTPHWLDALTQPMEDHVKRLAEAIERLLNVATEASTATPVAQPVQPDVIKQDPPKPSHGPEPIGAWAEIFKARKAMIAVIGGLLICVIVLIAVLSRQNNLAAKRDRGSFAQRKREGMSKSVPAPEATTSVDKNALAAPCPDTCKQGFVWREADERDHVCVSPEVRERTQEENRLASSRLAGGGAYGPNTCRQDFVWREAFPGDFVCVTPESRALAARDNQQAARRRACGE